MRFGYSIHYARSKVFTLLTEGPSGRKKSLPKLSNLLDYFKCVNQLSDSVLNLGIEKLRSRVKRVLRNDVDGTRDIGVW